MLFLMILNRKQSKTNQKLLADRGQSGEMTKTQI